jgi:phosphohistidine phosphatase
VWLNVAVDEIFTSPLVRARQTANLLAAGLKDKPPIKVKVIETLSPGHAPASVLHELARTAKQNRIALVGHEPGLGELAAHLIGSPRAIPFRKGGVCRVDLPSYTSRRPGELQWLLTPKMLRELGE